MTKFVIVLPCNCRGPGQASAEHRAGCDAERARRAEKHARQQDEQKKAAEIAKSSDAKIPKR